MLLAGKDATGADGKPAPNIGLILMYDTSSGAIKASTSVMLTCKKTDPCVSIFQLLPFAKKKCKQ